MSKKILFPIEKDYFFETFNLFLILISKAVSLSNFVKGSSREIQICPFILKYLLCDVAIKILDFQNWKFYNNGNIFTFLKTSSTHLLLREKNL